MTLEEHMVNVVDSLISTYPDSAPMDAALPYCTYQIIDGKSLVFMDKTTPDKKHAYIQLNVYAKSALEASNLIAQVEKTMLATKDFNATPATGARSIISDDPEAEIRGRMQDFSIWYPTK